MTACSGSSPSGPSATAGCSYEIGGSGVNVYAIINGETTAQCQSDAQEGLIGSGATATPISPSVITQPATCNVTDPSEPGVSVAIYPVNAGDASVAQLICTGAQSAASSGGADA